MAACILVMRQKGVHTENRGRERKNLGSESIAKFRNVVSLDLNHCSLKGWNEGSDLLQAGAMSSVGVQ